MTRYTFRHIDNGAVVESDLVIAHGEEWKAREDSIDPAWSVIPSGDFLFALRLSGIPGCAQLHQPCGEWWDQRSASMMTGNGPSDAKYDR